MLGLKRFVSVCLFFVLAVVGRTQISMPYIMGVVGNAGSTEKIFSGSILLEGGSCFLLSNGVSNYTQGTANLFSFNCVVAPVIESLHLIAYPNPFKDKVTIKSQSVFNFSTSVMYELLLYNALGVMIKTYKISIYTLRSGFEMATSFQESGTYYLKVQVGQLHIETLKLIKTQ
jgi:hypothetical protein